jgi:PAS domain-containing protein
MLAAAEEKYRSLVENLNDVVFTVDPQGIITYMSPVVEKIVGYAPNETPMRPGRGSHVTDGKPHIVIRSL